MLTAISTSLSKRRWQSRLANHPVESRHLVDHPAEVCHVAEEVHRLPAHPVEVRHVADHSVELRRLPAEVHRLPAEVCHLPDHRAEILHVADHRAEIRHVADHRVEIRHVAGRAAEVCRLADRTMEVPVLLPRCADSLLRCAMSLNISLTSLLMWVHPVYVPSVLRPCIPSSCLLSHANWNRRSHVIKSSRMDPFKQLGCRAVQQQHQTEECELERMGESQNAKCTRNLCSESTPLFPAIHCLASLLVSRLLYCNSFPL